LAAEQLDKLWDGWANALSGSYVKVLPLMELGKTREASAEFQQGFLTEIRKVYSEAACTAPKRFVGSKDWSAWVRHLYALSVKTDRSLRQAADSFESADARTAASKEAMNDLLALRRHFYVLHADTNTCRVNDYLFRFYEEVMKDVPAASELKAIRAAMDKADLSIKAKSDPNLFLLAKGKWTAEVHRILADGTIQPEEIATLRAATTQLYRAYGEPLE
jgi:hypothetical protein